MEQLPRHLQMRYLLRDSSGKKLLASRTFSDLKIDRGPEQEKQESIQQPDQSSPASGLSLETQGNAGDISENIIDNPESMDTLNINPEETNDTGTINNAEEETDTLPTPEDTIYFKLNRDSWIEVYDSGHNILCKRLVKGGEELTLTGIGPFSVLLGYAPGVEVIFNGEPFDQGPYTNSGIARFKLGTEENGE